MTKKVTRIPDETWDQHKQEIIALYQMPGSTFDVQFQKVICLITCIESIAIDGEGQKSGPTGSRQNVKKAPLQEGSLHRVRIAWSETGS